MGDEVQTFDVLDKMASWLEKILRKEFVPPDSYVRVRAVSQMDRKEFVSPDGHVRVKVGPLDRIYITIVSDRFDQLSEAERHGLISDILRGGGVKGWGGIASLLAYTPDELG